ncbi:MAG TPA: phosphatidylinositol-specific phospholipase C [Candidatus Elarobacter sp.]|jgi:1-phosphatidylinositol phosphodiesterase
MLSAIKHGLRFAACVFMVCAWLGAPAHAHKTSGYSHDDGSKTANPHWLTVLDDNVTLSQLSLPGTHDSMAFYGGDIAQAQTMSLDKQLQSGIRVLDIRCWHAYNSFSINHGFMPQFAGFDDVLNTVTGFLVNNPGETVLMRVTEAFTPVGTTRTFEQTFDGYRSRYADYFYGGTSDGSDPDNPKLKDMRGKIVLLQAFSGQRHGIPYPGTFNVQDKYSLASNADLYDKWRHVKVQLEDANSGAADVRYVNYLSGSGGSFPYFVASGHSSPGTSAPRLATGRTTPGWKSWKDFPRVNCAIGICTIAYEGTNVLTYERLGKNFKKRVGILFADFPGPGLIDRTIELNNSFKK